MALRDLASLFFKTREHSQVHTGRESSQPPHLDQAPLPEIKLHSKDAAIQREKDPGKQLYLFLYVKLPPVLTLILSARLLKDTIMLPGLLIFFRTRTVWAKSVGE